MPREREEAEKSLLVDRIVFRMEDFNYQLQQDRIEALMELAKPDLQNLADSVASAESGREGLTLIVNAIVAARHAQREVENKMWDAIDGGKPAQ
jgi:hypothetical protein